MQEKNPKSLVCDYQEMIDKGERRIRQMPIEKLTDKKKGSIFITT